MTDLNNWAIKIFVQGSRWLLAAQSLVVLTLLFYLVIVPLGMLRRTYAWLTRKPRHTDTYFIVSQEQLGQMDRPF